LTLKRAVVKLKEMFRLTWVRRTGVAVALLVSLCTGTVALPHAVGFEDSACGRILVSHDESAHYIGPARSSAHTDGQHCFLCHSLRSFCPFFEKYEQRDGALRAERPHAAPVAVASSLEWSLAPGRAPPV